MYAELQLCKTYHSFDTYAKGLNNKIKFQVLFMFISTYEQFHCSGALVTNAKSNL